MSLNEAYPLILFTLLSGAAFGLWASINALEYWVKESGRQASLFRIGGWLAVVMQTLAILASLLHLALPLSFYRALISWQTSWLSREVWFAGVFFVVIATSMILYEWNRRGKIMPAWLLPGIGSVGVLLGLGTTMSSGMIYLDAKGFPGWMNPTIAFLFPLTGLAVGLAFGFALWLGRKGERPGAKSFAAVMFVLALAVAFANWLTLFGPKSLAANISQLEWLALVILILVTWALYALMFAKPRFLMPLWVWVAFGTLTASVVLTRVWFYTYAVHS